MLIDHVLVVLFAIILPLNGWRNYPRFLAVLRREPAAMVRRAVYIGNVIALLALTLVVLLWWFYKHRAFSGLGLIWSPVPAFVAAITIVSAAVTLSFLLLNRIARSVMRRPGLKWKLSTAPELLPRTTQELRLFLFMSLCAGMCEEILFRGYLIWYLGTILNTHMAVVLSSVIFGIGHAYQGLKGIFIITPVGLIFAMLYLWSGSIWAPVILHIAIDGWSGLYGKKVFGEQELAPAVNENGAS
jgi:CAAX protease family protein